MKSRFQAAGVPLREVRHLIFGFRRALLPVLIILRSPTGRCAHDAAAFNNATNSAIRANMLEVTAKLSSAPRLTASV